MSFHLPETMAIALLDKLGNDDGFRTTFAANPREALAQLGFAPAADTSVREGLWKCLRVSELASNEVIQSSRTALLRQIAAERVGHQPIALEVAPTTVNQAA